MRKIFLFMAIIMGFIMNVKAQEAPYFRQYLFDQTLLNPAAGAKYDYFTIKLTAEDKWLNLPKNPISQALTANFKFKNNKMGLNTALLNNSYGSVSYTGTKLSYFYYSKLNVDGDYISFGIYASAFQYVFNLNDIDATLNDPAINQNTITLVYPNAGAGVYYKQKYFSLALSAANLLPYKPKYGSKSIEPAKPVTLFFYGDTRMSNEIKTFTFEPSVLFLIDRNFKRQFNLNGRFIFNNTYWFGLSYRDALDVDIFSVHDVQVLFGMKFFKKLNFAYAYDFGVLSTRKIFGGSHSIMLGFDFINTRRRNVPMYF